MRPYQVATAAAIVVIAAVAMFDSRSVFNPSGGTAPGDVGSRWYPFWAATLMGVAAAVVVYRSLTTPQAVEGIFDRPASVFAVVKLVLPMLVYVALIGGVAWKDSATDITYTVVPALGFYIATALYMGAFAWWIGRYKIWWVAAILVAFPLVIYLAFEIGFRVTLPKSFLYSSGVLPF